MKKFQVAITLFCFIWVAFPANLHAEASYLTISQLKNATYRIGVEKINLKNGTYRDGTIKDGNFFEVNFVTAAFGDLNKDGNNDAAVIYFSNGGGSGCFFELAAMENQNGKPVQVASVELGDRPEVKSISIKGGKIILKMVVHGPNDSMARPTVKQTRKYMLSGNKLVPVR
jgi:hypothetical protein